MNQQNETILAPTLRWFGETLKPRAVRNDGVCVIEWTHGGYPTGAFCCEVVDSLEDGSERCRAVVRWDDHQFSRYAPTPQAALDDATAAARAYVDQVDRGRRLLLGELL